MCISVCVLYIYTRIYTTTNIHDIHPQVRGAVVGPSLRHCQAGHGARGLRCGHHVLQPDPRCGIWLENVMKHEGFWESMGAAPNHNPSHGMIMI